MSIKTQQSLSGFFIKDLNLRKSNSGTPYFTARVGQHQFASDGHGGFTQTGTERFNIVQFGKAAERSFSQFRSGDKFVAEGYVRDTEYTKRNGETVSAQEFVVKKIGHDTGWTKYSVERPEPQSPAVEEEAVGTGIEPDASADLGAAIDAAEPGPGLGDPDGAFVPDQEPQTLEGNGAAPQPEDRLSLPPAPPEGPQPQASPVQQQPQQQTSPVPHQQQPAEVATAAPAGPQLASIPSNGLAARPDPAMAAPHLAR
ncbi:single-stranded DNA-binding protein [Leucobacter sp. UCD-THU]|uniref:single-stranded DNA-binding protein n=1 Tax=Leucobacter sp. UCD-THU TaxID=1292023 RepID=UPI000375EACD|nr:single-stranded DNA-binding protein [Leucobacter sp. UCD-THU]EYT56575.1 single-stranded DNA-binding protein [Leucobacter sp. UCD-THU]